MVGDKDTLDILDGLLARGIGGPDTLRVAIEALRQPMSVEECHD